MTILENAAKAWKRFWAREPVLILGLVQAAIALAIVFGVPVSGEQKAGLVFAAIAIIEFVKRQQVSPRGNDGPGTTGTTV